MKKKHLIIVFIISGSLCLISFIAEIIVRYLYVYSEFKIITALIAIVSLLIYLIIKVTEKEQQGWQRLAAVAAILGFIIFLIISLIVGMKSIFSILLFCSAGATLGLLTIEIIAWIREGFRGNDKS